MCTLFSHRHISYYSYHHLLRQELEAVVLWHNNHHIHAQKNRNVVTGVLVTFHEFPEQYDGE